MFKTLKSRFIFYTVLYTVVLVLLLYLVQRFVAPSLYVNAVLQDEAALALEVAETIESDPSLNRLNALNNRVASEIFIFNERGQLIFGSEASLAPIDVVRSFQEMTWHRFIRTQDQTFLEYFYVSDNSIILLRSPFAPIISNIAFLDRFFMITGLVAIILAIPLSYFFAKSFTDPVVKIKKLARAFSELHFEYDLNLKRNDELKTLEKSLKSMAFKLKKTVQELETELAKEKALDQVQKDFVARVSHELKTPLSIIKNSVETLFDSVHEPLPFDLKTMIDEEIDHMVRLSHDLIDLSQLESGHFKVKKTEISLNDLTHDLVKGFSDDAITLIETGSLSVFADPSRMRQVLQNLIQNSLQHKPEASEVTITLNEAQKTWTIQNNTSHPVAVEQLFNPFYKGQEKSPGSGLGLAIVKSIIKAHGADIKAHQAGETLFVVIKFDADPISV